MDKDMERFGIGPYQRKKHVAAYNPYTGKFELKKAGSKFRNTDDIETLYFRDRRSKGFTKNETIVAEHLGKGLQNIYTANVN